MLKGFELRLGQSIIGIPGSARRLAAFVALQERHVNRLYVAGMLWPNVSEQRSNGNLRTALWRLSRPGVRVVSSDSHHVWLTAGVKVDLRDCWERTRRIIGNPKNWREDDVEAITCAGEVLPDYYDDWVVLERERFRQMRMHALEALSWELARVGRYAAAVETGLAAVAAEPLRESAHRAVVATHLTEGNRSEAIRHFRLFRRLLKSELGLSPSPAMEELVAGLPVD